MNANLTADHYAAYSLTQKYRGEHLSEEEVNKVFGNFVHIDETFVPIAMKYQASTAAFNSFRFVDSAVNEVHPVSWWKLIPSSSISSTAELLRAINSSASIERLFSIFGFVHSRIIDSVEKAAKPAFIYRLLLPTAYNTGTIPAETEDEET